MPSNSSSSAVHPLKDWRVRNGVTLGAMAARLRMHAQNIHRYEHGERMPPKPVRKRIQSMTKGAVPAEEEFWWRAKRRAMRARARVVEIRKRVDEEEDAEALAPA